MKLIFHDIERLDMILEEWKQLSRKAWENDYDYLQKDRFPKKGVGWYTIRNCNRSTDIECIPETKSCWFFHIYMINLIKFKDELKVLEELDGLQ